MKFKYIIALAICLPLTSCGLPIKLTYNVPDQSFNFSSSAKGGLAIDVTSAK